MYVNYKIIKMDKLPKDILLFMALKYDMMDVLSFCQVNKKFNDLLCKNNTFWMNKVLFDFGKYNHIPKNIIKKYGKTNGKNLNWKDYYKFLYEIKYLDKKEINELFTCASYDGNLEIIKVLIIDSRLDPSHDDNCAIGVASQNGHLETAKLLLSDPRVNTDTGNENYSLRISSKNGHLKIVRLLLNDKSVDPSTDSNIAIRWASKNGHLEIVRLLLSDDRVDPSERSNDAIINASKKGYKEIVKMLKADPRYKPNI